MCRTRRKFYARTLGTSDTTEVQKQQRQPAMAKTRFLALVSPASGGASTRARGEHSCVHTTGVHACSIFMYYTREHVYGFYVQRSSKLAVRARGWHDAMCEPCATHALSFSVCIETCARSTPSCSIYNTDYSTNNVCTYMHTMRIFMYTRVHSASSVFRFQYSMWRTRTRRHAYLCVLRATFRTPSVNHSGVCWLIAKRTVCRPSYPHLRLNPPPILVQRTYEEHTLSLSLS